MSKVILKYLLSNFLNTFFSGVSNLGFGIILNLFEEIEIFKKVDTSFLFPLMLTSIFVPSTILISSFYNFHFKYNLHDQNKNSKDLLTLKIYGFSSIKIFHICFTSFFLGWFVLMIINPNIFTFNFMKKQKLSMRVILSI